MRLSLLCEESPAGYDPEDYGTYRLYINWFFNGGNQSGQANLKNFPEIKKMFPNGFPDRLASGLSLTSNTAYKYIYDALKNAGLPRGNIKQIINTIHDKLSKWVSNQGIDAKKIQCPMCVKDNKRADTRLEIDHTDGKNNNKLSKLRILCGRHNRQIGKH